MKDDLNLEHKIVAYEIVPTKAYPEVPRHIHHFATVKLVLIKQSPYNSEEREHHIKYMNKLFNTIIAPRYGHIDGLVAYYGERFVEAINAGKKLNEVEG